MTRLPREHVSPPARLIIRLREARRLGVYFSPASALRLYRFIYFRSWHCFISPIVGRHRRREKMSPSSRHAFCRHFRFITAFTRRDTDGCSKRTIDKVLYINKRNIQTQNKHVQEKSHEFVYV